VAAASTSSAQTVSSSLIPVPPTNLPPHFLIGADIGETGIQRQINRPSHEYGETVKRKIVLSTGLSPRERSRRRFFNGNLINNPSLPVSSTAYSPPHPLFSPGRDADLRVGGRCRTTFQFERFEDVVQVQRKHGLRDARVVQV
jgi:hypothetical protein